MTGEVAGMEKPEAAQRGVEGELHQWRCDMRILTKEGKSRWLSDASVQHLDDSGRVIGSMGILEDITERKQAELSALALSKLGQSFISATTINEAARLLLQAADGLFGWDALLLYLFTGNGPGPSGDLHGHRRWPTCRGPTARSGWHAQPGQSPHH
jgi:hypothetical protein